MKPLGFGVDRRLLIRLLAAVVLLGVLAAAPHGALADKKIQVAPPPPPSGEKQGEPAYDYKHEIKTVRRDRKPVLALLRAGDVVELQEYLPFGRGVNISRSGSAEADVKTTRTDGTGKETTATVTGQGSTTIRTGREDAPVFMPVPIRQFLTRELVTTRQFVVVERERILEIARELALAKTAAVNPETSPRPGRLIGVHYIVEGSYFPAGGLPADDPALAPVRREINKRRLNLDPTLACVMYLTVYKVETGEVKAVACGADLRPLVAVQRAVEDLLDQMRDVVEPIRVARVDKETGMAVLDIGSSDGIVPGTQFAIQTAPAAEGEPAQTVTAVAEKVDLLSSTVKLSDPKAPVHEGASAKRVEPPAKEKPQE
ncbi:MAG: CsgG/HfaB family protein [Phycisphaerae bacterium]